MRTTTLVPLLLMIVPVITSGDEVHLRGGGRVSGVIIAKTPRSVTIDVGPGRITFPADRVDRIESGSSALASYRERASLLPGDDLEGWLELGEWAKDAGLETQAREAFERARAIAPGDARANNGLGHVLQGGQWMNQEDAYRAQGLLFFEGRWVSREERADVERSRDRETEARLHARAAEAQARAHEADARAAEARARAAEAETQQDGSTGSMPYVYAGAAVAPVPRCGQGYEPCSGEEHPRARRDRPTPRRHTPAGASLGAERKTRSEGEPAHKAVRPTNPMETADAHPPRPTKAHD